MTDQPKQEIRYKPADYDGMQWVATHAYIMELLRRIAVLRNAAITASRNIGVPDADYPAPFAEAHRVLEHAIAATKGDDEWPHYAG